LPDATELVHGTCVALGRTAALLRGPSGAGKSDLALRFLFLARRGPAALEPPNGERILVRPPETIRGRMEVRGIGIVEVKSLAEADLALVVDLASAGAIERMPEAGRTTRLLGVEVPTIALCPWEGSAPIKLAIALARARQS